jgi:ABC-type amino acid transport system permease subunit
MYHRLRVGLLVVFCLSIGNLFGLFAQHSTDYYSLSMVGNAGNGIFAPYYLFGISTSYQYRFYAVLIGFSLNYAAYFAEIYRSGIQSIPAGQREAATVMGYSRSQTFFRILFPQMVKRVMPPVTNEVITLVKDTSLAFALAYTEMFTMAKQIAASQASLMPLFVAGVFYYIFNFVVATVMEQIEKKLDYYR